MEICLRLTMDKIITRIQSADNLVWLYSSGHIIDMNWVINELKKHRYREYDELNPIHDYRNYIKLLPEQKKQSIMDIVNSADNSNGKMIKVIIDLS